MHIATSVPSAVRQDHPFAFMQKLLVSRVYLKNADTKMSSFPLKKYIRSPPAICRVLFHYFSFIIVLYIKAILQRTFPMTENSKNKIVCFQITDCCLSDSSHPHFKRFPLHNANQTLYDITKQAGGGRVRHQGTRSAITGQKTYTLLITKYKSKFDARLKQLPGGSRTVQNKTGNKAKTHSLQHCLVFKKKKRREREKGSVLRQQHTNCDLQLICILQCHTFPRMIVSKELVGHLRQNSPAKKVV